MESMLFLNRTDMFLNKSFYYNWNNENFDRSTNTNTASQVPLLVYCSFFLVLIIIGALINLIVVTAYKFGDTFKKNSKRKNFSLKASQFARSKNYSFYNENLSNYNNNFGSFAPGTFYARRNTCNKLFNLNNAGNSLINERRVSLAITPLTSSTLTNTTTASLVNNKISKNSKQRDSSYKLNLAESKTELSYLKSNRTLNSNNLRSNLNKRKSSQYEFSAMNLNGSVNLNSQNALSLIGAPVFNLGLSRNRRTLCSYFILSLGCCDLLICVLNMPICLLIETGYFDGYVKKLFVHNFMADFWCKMAYFVAQIPIALEIEILLTIAIDRYSSVFRPIKFYFFDRNKLKLTLVLQIFLSSVLSLPNFLFFKSFKLDNNLLKLQQKTHSIYFDLNNNSSVANLRKVSVNGDDDSSPHLIHSAKLNFFSLSNYCVVRDEFSLAYAYYQCFLLFIFVLNLVIISVCYIKVYKHVYRASKHQRIESITSACTNSSANSNTNNFINNNNKNNNNQQILNSQLSIGGLLNGEANGNMNMNEMLAKKQRRKMMRKNSFFFKMRDCFGKRDGKQGETYLSNADNDYAVDDEDEDAENEDAFDERNNQIKNTLVANNNGNNSDFGERKILLNKEDFELSKSNLIMKNFQMNSKNTLREEDEECELDANCSSKKKNSQLLDRLKRSDNEELILSASQRERNYLRRVSCPVVIHSSNNNNNKNKPKMQSFSVISNVTASIQDTNSTILQQQQQQQTEIEFVKQIKEKSNGKINTESKIIADFNINSNFKTNEKIDGISNDTQATSISTKRFVDSIVKLNKQEQTNSIAKKLASTSAPNNNNNNNNQKPTLITRIRRFSENPNLFYSKKQSIPNSTTNGSNCLFDAQSGVSTTNGILFRRHTSRRYKHGKTARVLGIATLALTLTWTPYWIFIFKSTKHLGYNLHLNTKLINAPVVYFLLIKLSKNSYYLNYLLNPIFYSFLNQRFRQHVNSLFEIVFKFIFKFCCCCCCCYKKLSNKLNDRNELRQTNNGCVNGLNSSLSPILQSRRVIDLDSRCNQKKETRVQSSKLFKTRFFAVFSSFFTNCCSKINSKNTNCKQQQQQQQHLDEQFFYTNTTPNITRSNTKIGTFNKVNLFDNLVHVDVNSQLNLNDQNCHATNLTSSFVK